MLEWATCRTMVTTSSALRETVVARTHRGAPRLCEKPTLQGILLHFIDIKKLSQTCTGTPSSLASLSLPSYKKRLILIFNCVTLISKSKIFSLVFNILTGFSVSPPPTTYLQEKYVSINLNVN